MTTPSDVELYKLMSPEEQEQYLDMLRDIAAVGPKPTRKQLLRALLPHLQAMFGDVYEDYKPELEAKYGVELVSVHKELEGNK